MRPTIREVAEKAGVAPTTVSRVLNNSGYVSAETRARVEAAIAELDYTPNMLSRGLRLKRTNVIALVVSDITNPFWTTVTRGVEDAAHADGVTVILCNTDEKPTKLSNYVRVLLQQQVDGILMVPADHTNDAILAVQAQDVPLVVVDRVPDGVMVDVVRGDSERGAYQLVSYLIELGHQRIAILSGPLEASTSQQRIEGYRRALGEHQIPVDESLVFCGEYNPHHGYQTAYNLLQQEPRPTAIFAGNSMIAVGVLGTLSDMGVRVPEELSLVSFDDLLPGVHIDPFLTIIDQSPYHIGYTAAQLLLQKITGMADENTHQEIVLPVKLIKRRSCSPVRRKA